MGPGTVLLEAPVIGVKQASGHQVIIWDPLPSEFVGEEDSIGPCVSFSSQGLRELLQATGGASPASGNCDHGGNVCDL